MFTNKYPSPRRVGDLSSGRGSGGVYDLDLDLDLGSNTVVGSRDLGSVMGMVDLVGGERRRKGRRWEGRAREGEK